MKYKYSFFITKSKYNELYVTNNTILKNQKLNFNNSLNLKNYFIVSININSWQLTYY